MDFEKHLEKFLSKTDIQALLSSFKEDAKHGLLVNTNKINSETILKTYPNLKRHPIIKNAFIYDKNEYDLGKSLLHELGAFYLQEPSAMLPSYFLNPTKEDYVLDMCAAPGGKTIGASFLMQNEGVIISNDISKSRHMETLENIERLGVANTILINNDLDNYKNLFSEKFSKVILDAPCSGSGMFRKDTKMLDDWSYEKVLKFAKIQKELILLAYSFLMPGGTLIYSTCSYSYEEDEEIIEYLKKCTNCEIIDVKNPLFYQSKAKLGVHLFPHIFPGEGHYLCLVHKPGKLKKILQKPNDILEKFGNYKFLSKYPFLFKNMSIIRKGVKYSEIKGDYEALEFHYARSLKSYPQIVNLTLKETLDYLKGLEINKKSPFKGEILIIYNNLPICFSKTNGEIIKNRYPKGLRKNYIVLPK